MNLSSRHDSDFDVLVAGAGSVGMSVGVALAGLGWRVAIVGVPGGAGVPAAPDSAFETRIYAVSPGNVGWLESLGAWSRIDATRIEPIGAMEIRGDEGALLALDAYGCGLSALAYIVEDGRLQAALEAEARARCTWIEDTVADTMWNATRVRIGLDRHGDRTAALLVAADGARSAVRRAAGIEVRTKPYGQCGVVANFRCERPHRGMARQWFRHDGILAWLPLPGDRISMVWSTFDAHAAELTALPAGLLAEAVASAGDRTLGGLEALSPAVAFPLQLSRASSTVATRLALAGDSAHTVHPLAGQGLNLGLRDARALVAAIGPHQDGADCGSAATLERYRRARTEDVLAMEIVTDGLHTLFSVDNPLVRLVRNRGLALTDRMGFVKRALVSAAVR
jgi:2-polyprenylphenol 6-hydroxylase